MAQKVCIIILWPLIIWQGRGDRGKWPQTDGNYKKCKLTLKREPSPLLSNSPTDQKQKNYLKIQPNNLEQA
jgi:hypothetical protein